MLYYTYSSQRLPEVRLFSIAKNLVLESSSAINRLCVGMLLSFHPRSIKVSLYPLLVSCPAGNFRLGTRLTLSSSLPVVSCPAGNFTGTLNVAHVIKYSRPSALFVLQATKLCGGLGIPERGYQNFTTDFPFMSHYNDTFCIT